MKTSKIIIIAVALSYIFVHAYKGYWKDPRLIIANDVIEYYAFLPATFIYGDITLKFIEEDTTGFFPGKIWGHKLENGNFVNKATLGLAIMYSPFFLVSHAIALIGPHEADGYTAPYAAALTISSLFFFLAGLILLRKLLMKYFTDSVTALTLAGVALGTNISVYLLQVPAVSHAYSFFLFVAFIYLLHQWLHNKKTIHILLAGVTLGLITLIRPTNGIIAILFLFWEVDSFQTLKIRFKLLIKQWKKLIIFTICVCIIWLPQLLYWKYVTGNFFYYSYGEESFFWMQPKFGKVLFSFRKGWLLYTPLMIIAIIGFRKLYQTQKQLFAGIFLLFLLNLYIISSWWCWWYGGSFGHRAFIESYVLMAFPLAAFIQHFWTKTIRHKIIIVIIILAFIAHNIFQTVKFANGAIHWDSMSKYAYFETLWKAHPNDMFYYFLEAPDYKNALNGLPEKLNETVVFKILKNNSLPASYFNTHEFQLLAMNDFEISIETDEQVRANLSNYMKQTGETSYLTNNQQHHLPGYTVQIGELFNLGISGVLAEFNVFSFDPVPDESLHLVVSIENESEVLYYYSASSSTIPIIPGQWNTRFLFVDLPSDALPELMLKSYVWNKDGRALSYVDQFKVYGIKTPKM